MTGEMLYFVYGFICGVFAVLVFRSAWDAAVDARARDLVKQRSGPKL